MNWTPPTYPARPTNGGALQGALPKIGDWRAEPKWDGWRAMVHLPSRTMFNRKNEPLSIADEFEIALEKLHNAFDGFVWLDCEALARRHKEAVGSLIVLDAPTLGGTYLERRARLERAASRLPDSLTMNLRSESAYLTLSARDGHWMHAEMMRCVPLVEGTVWKRADSIYPIQVQSPEREFPYWIKHKFK